jgi:hypothetical protein
MALCSSNIQTTVEAIDSLWYNNIIHMTTYVSWRLNILYITKLRLPFELQKYLTFNINKYVRSLLAKLRLSAHILAIETGRFCKPTIPANERFCKACKDKVEDEHHFLIECPIYNSVRDTFFKLFNRKFNETTEVTINCLLNPSSSQDLNNICLYLKESYSLRDSTFKNIQLSSSNCQKLPNDNNNLI